MPITNNCKIGKNTKIWHSELVNLYGGCQIGDNCNIGAFVEIGKNVIIGNNCKIQAHVFIPEGVTIEDSVFIGPGTIFTNKLYPKRHGWKKTLVKYGVAIGANCTILPGITIGKHCIIGAGSVVTKDTAGYNIYIGNPAKVKIGTTFGIKMEDSEFEKN